MSVSGSEVGFTTLSILTLKVPISRINVGPKHKINDFTRENCLRGENRCHADERKKTENWMMENFEAPLEKLVFRVLVHGTIHALGGKGKSFTGKWLVSY